MWWFNLDDTQNWQLVGAYEAAGLQAHADQESDFVWEAAPGMVTSCGPTKAPAGMGIFEAEAIASGLTPTLALVLKTSTQAPPLTTENIRLALDNGRQLVLLQPSVVPRNLAIELRTGNIAPEHEKEVFQYQDLVQTQLEMEICMEHKVGRGWLGSPCELIPGTQECRSKNNRIEQAFLLRQPTDNLPDRAFFGGQTDPVPALLGPPDACMVNKKHSTRDEKGKGEGSLELVPSDIWGASLRDCNFTVAELENLDARALKATTRLVPEMLGLEALVGRKPLEIGGIVQKKQEINFQAMDLLPENIWRRVVIELKTETNQVVADITYRSLVHSVSLGELGAFNATLEDLLTQIPYAYPVVKSPQDDTRYTILYVPNWQIVEALQRLENNDIQTPASRPAATRDGVGWVLAHPELLSLQVVEGEEGTQRPDLADVLSGGQLGLLDWGYTAGFYAGRNPIILPNGQIPTWEQTRMAHRSEHHALFLFCSAFCGVILIAGVRRLPELWTAVPEERADYWPGAFQDDESASFIEDSGIAAEKNE